MLQNCKPVGYGPSDCQIEDIAQIMGWSKEDAMQKTREFLEKLEKSVSRQATT
jgi:hypothetical protein